MKWFDAGSVSLVDHSYIKDIKEGIEAMSKRPKKLRNTPKSMKLEHAMELAIKEFHDCN